MPTLSCLRFGRRFCEHTSLLFLWIGWATVVSQIVLDPSPADVAPKRRSYIYSLGPGEITTEGKYQRSRRATDDVAPDQATPEQLASHNVSALLDSLFNQYNKTFRPGYGHGPTRVLLNMVVISIGPISELNSDYSLDVYFRQKWRDERLKFNGSEGMRELALNNLMLNDIWKPDTYFRNGKEYYVHTITTANKLLRLKTSGDIVYSMRLTFYPADTQFCPLIIGSFAYQSHEVLYAWDNIPDPVGLEAKLKNSSLAQFQLQDIQTENFFSLFQSGMKKENYSMVKADFKLQRRMGYFLLQIYLPCVLIVVLSWVSFWLNREATERLTLGITALLTLATMNQDQKDLLPKTSYPTALEWYILICNLYVSASIIQFAAVHFFTKTGFEEVNLPKERLLESDDEWEDIPSSQIADALDQMANPKVVVNNNCNDIGKTRHRARSNPRNRRGTRSIIIGDEERFANESTWQKLLYCITGNENYRSELLRRGRYRVNPSNSVSLLDRASRVGFPLSFGLVNLFYWTSFMFAEPTKRSFR